MARMTRPFWGSKFKVSNEIAMTLVSFISFAGFSVMASAAPPAEPASLLAKQFRPIEFTSRAQCSINSGSPARSILIVGDGQDAGRLAFNLKSRSGVDVTEAEALTVYRKAVGFTFKTVIDKLISGELPLISGPTADPALKPLMERCDRQRGCRALEDKLSALWSFSLQNTPAVKIRRPGSARLGCHKITQFSALHGHLNKTSPNRKDLEEIATVLVDKSKGPSSCDGESAQSDRHFLLQLDLVSIPEETFEKEGYDFWNSVKTYAAWAWRNAPETQHQMGRFGSLFPNLALEEEILLVPNGCRSITLPKCELQRLSLDAIRELAKPPGNASGFERNLPDGPQADLISRKVRSINNGFLGTQATDAQAWVKNFTNRFNDARWVSRNKLQGAIRQSRILEKISNDTLVKDIEADLAQYKANENMALASQMAAVCLEARLLQDPNLKILRPDFENVIAAGSELLIENASQKEGLQKVTNSAQDLAAKLLPLCQSLEKSLFQSRRTDSKTFSWTYLADWARERMGSLVAADEASAQIGAEAKRRGWDRPQTYLELTQSAASPIEICRSPLTCAQQSFKSYIDVYYVATWASALQSARKLKDSNLFNPYAELTACKVYDPWFATEQANAALTQRLVVSALSSILPVPVFFESLERRPTAVALKSEPVTSADGTKELRFNAEFAEEESRKTFFTDLGPLTGAPCAVQYSNEMGTPFQVYGISGITVNFCSDGKTGPVDVQDDGRSKSSTAKYSVCGGCTVNAVGAVSAATYAAPSGPLRFIFGAMRAFSLYSDATKDAVNRPHTYTVNPDYVVDTYRENGNKIPQHCTDSLTSGYRCFPDTCAAHAASAFERRSGLRVKSSSISYDGDDTSYSSSNMTQTRNGLAGLRIAECDAEILVRVRCTPAERKYELLTEFSSFARACKQVINNLEPDKSK